METLYYYLYKNHFNAMNGHSEEKGREKSRLNRLYISQGQFQDIVSCHLYNKVL